MPLRHRSFQLILLILGLYMVHAHYNELDAIYAFNFQPNQCLYYVKINSNILNRLTPAPIIRIKFDISYKTLRIVKLLLQIPKRRSKTRCTEIIDSVLLN